MNLVLPSITQLAFQAKDTFKTMKLDIFWDKETDETKRLSLKSELTSRDLDIQFRFVEHLGEMKAKLVDDGLRVEAKFNDHFVKARAAHSHEASNYGLEVLGTSCDQNNELDPLLLI